MNETVRVACSQAEPVVLSRDATIDKLETPAAEAAGSGAEGILYAGLGMILVLALYHVAVRGPIVRRLRKRNAVAAVR